MPRQAGSCLSCQTLGGARVVCLLLPSRSRTRIAAFGAMRLARAAGSCAPAQGSLPLTPIRVQAVPSQPTALRSRPEDRMVCSRGRSSLQARRLVAPFKVISPRLVRMRTARCRSDERRGLLQASPRASEFRPRLCTERRLTLPSS
jgi:hypothetical protein